MYTFIYLNLIVFANKLMNMCYMANNHTEPLIALDYFLHMYICETISKDEKLKSSFMKTVLLGIYINVIFCCEIPMPYISS